MDIASINSGKLRGIGYDSRRRLLEVHFDDGRVIQYSGISDETWRRLRSSSSPWSYYRDNIEEEFSGKSVSGKPSSGKNPLDDLFGAP